MIPVTSPDIARRRIKKISIGLGALLFILSLALPTYIVTTTMTKKPTYAVVKKDVTMNAAQTIGVSHPTINQYYELYSTYPETLSCKCSQLSIRYDLFLQVQIHFHPICSSIFISQEWINALLQTSETLSLNDFRKTASYSFQALRTLCQLSQQTTEYNLMQFLSNEYLSTNVAPIKVFESLMMARLDQFKSSTTKSFLLSFSMIRNIIQSNALFSSLQSNYKLHVRDNNISISPAVYDGNCSCALSTQCVTQSSIYDTSSSIIVPIPGFYTGCYVMDSLLRSDLRCFYNQTCISLLQSYIPSLGSLTVTGFDLSLSDMYEQNTTIENILNSLMGQQMSTRLSYKDYYQQCAPSYCSYPGQTAETIDLIENKTDVASLIGLVVGIIGGIIAILHLVIPTLVKVIIG